MMDMRTSRRVLRYEWIGFGLVIAFLWLDEVVDLPHVIAGSPPTLVNWRESIIETLVVLILAVVVTGATRSLLRRVKHLEGLLYICAQCQRVRSEHRWMPLDEFLQTHSQVDLAATFCEDCLSEHQGSGRGH